MLIDFDAVLIAPDGTTPIPERPPAAGEDQRAIPALTLAKACVTALIQPQADDGQTEGLAYQLYTLAHRIRGGGEVELEADQVALIKRRLERAFMPWVVGQCWDFLEGRSAPGAPLTVQPPARTVKARRR